MPRLPIIAAFLCLAPLGAYADSAVSYESEIKPIFREHCMGCHNADKRKGGLALDSYAATIEGGSSGEVVYEGDAESSRLYQLVNHDDGPEMPPQQDPIAAAKRDLIKRWISEGLAEQSGTAKKAQKKVALSFQPIESGDSLGPMPNGLTQQPFVVTERAAAVAALATSHRAPLLAVGGQQQVAIYRSDTTELLGVVPFPEGNPHVVRFSRDGSLLVIGGGRGANNGHVALHKVADGERLIRIGDELDVVLAADIDSSLSYVVLGGPSKTAKIFDARTGDELHKITKHTDWVTATEFSPDGKFLATADRAGGLIVWEAATAREYQVFEGHKSCITQISWRADSKVFATGAEEGNIRIWDPEKVKPVRNFAHGGGVTSLQMTSDGGLISGGRDRRVKRWDGNGKQQTAYAPAADMITQVAMTNDRTRVFAGDWTGAVRIFETDNAKHVLELTANPPTLEARLEKAKSRLAVEQAKVRVVIDKTKKLDAAVIAAQKKYHAAVQRLASVEHKARVASQKIYDLVRLRENDEVEDDAAVRKRLAAMQHGWNNHLKATTEAYIRISRQSASLQKARAVLESSRRELAKTQQTLTTPRLRVQELTSMTQQP